MKDLDLDSNEELFFWWWCEELQDKGYILKHVREPKSFVLSDTVKYLHIKKNKPTESTLLREHHYTPDSGIIWTNKAIGIFTEVTETLVSKLLISDSTNTCYVEVKPSYDQNNMTRLFTINQKWIYQKYDIYINKVIPEKLFEQTFTPTRFLFTNKSKQKRKIKFKVRTLQEYLSTFEGKQVKLF